MVKIQRTTQKIFGGTASPNDIAVLGSFKTGTPVYTDNVSALQNSAYEKGYGAALVANEAPFLEEQNSIPYILSTQLAYLFQQGIPEWDEGTTYYINSFVQLGGVIFKSLQDDNTGNEPVQGSEYWEILQTGSSAGSGLQIGDIGISLYIDETLGLRRYLNGSLLEINKNTQGFLDWLKGLQATSPSLFTTEENWQAAKTLSAYGQVGQFVIDETAGTIRLPAVVNIQGVFDLQNLGLTVAAGLPNIKGESGGIWSEPGGKGAFKKTTQVNGNRSAGQNGSIKNLQFDASDSNPIYSDDAKTVQIEAIQYPYYIQIATGQETEVNITNEIELNNPYTLFDNKYSDAPLYNISWLWSGGQYNSGTVYVTAYEALQVEYNEDIEVGTTVTLPSGGSYTKRGLSVKNISSVVTWTQTNSGSSGVEDWEHAFDNSILTWAKFENPDDYLEITYDQPVVVTEFTVTGGWINGISHWANYSMYSVDDNETETLIATSSGAGEHSLYYSSATFDAVTVKKVRFKLANNVKPYYARVFELNVTSEAVANIIDDYDFVLNTADETFRLPLKSHLASGKVVTGNGNALGFTYDNNAVYYPNASQVQDAATGTIRMYTVSEDIVPIGVNGEAGTRLSNNHLTMGITQNADKSGLIVSDENLLLYVYVGETVQNANLIDAGRISETVAQKLGRDNKEEIMSWLMPDYSAGISKSWGTPQIAETDGYVLAYVRGVSPGASISSYLKVNGSVVAWGGGENSKSYSSASCFVPVHKGDTYQSYNIPETPQYGLYFYPLRGNNV